MKKLIALFPFLLILFQLSQAQKEPVNDVLNYSDTLKKGIEYYDNEKFEKALKCYLAIPESDTLYPTVAAEVILTYYQLEKYQEAVEYGKAALKKGIFFNQEFYMNMGSCYDNLEQYQNAIDLYKEAIKTFPYSYYLYYNIGFSSTKLEKYNEALDAFKMVIKINPVYAKVHYQIATLAINEGQTALAAMALNAYLTISPNSNSSNHVLSLLNDLVTTNYKSDIKPQGIDLMNGEDFSEINLLLENYVALDKKFKVKTKIQLPLIKQSYLLFQELSKIKPNDKFWYQTYAPTFIDIIKENQFEAYSYYIMQSSTSDKHQKIINSNVSKVKAFISWVTNKLDDNHRVFLLPFEKSEYKDISVYRANGGFAISFIGHVNEEGKVQGYAESYYPDGNLLSTMSYNKDGLFEGEKISYYPNGNLKEVDYYKNGVLQDSLIQYSRYGRPTVFYSVKDDALDGEVRYYHNSGSPSTIMFVKDKQLQGERKKYFESGPLYSVINFTDGKAEGRYVEYYNNGQIYEVANYKLDKLEGVDTVYHRNGQIRAIQNYTDGERNGEYIEYFDNGVLNEKGQYKAGIMIGTYSVYNIDGTLFSQAEYDEEGKKNGVYKEFYDSGEVYYELDYKKGEVVAYRYYDKQGKIIHEDKRRFGTFAFEGYHKNGIKSTEGEFGTKYN
ncbi:MAG: tetratricopeptide repeat protein [Bacteroidales bacterium]|nr:tetratricopeptide repeat protein [Bacteroidales bacterium]